MESLGEFLKKSRELRQLSQEDLAKVIRYHVSRIQALEEDQHKSLPAPAYVKGMLRSISKYLGLEVNDVLNRYDDFLKAHQQVEISPLSTDKLDLPAPSFYMQKNFLLISATVSFLVLIIVASLFFKESKKIKPIGNVVLSPNASQPSDDSSSTEPGLSGGLKLMLEASKDVWLKIQVDSQSPAPIGLKMGNSVQFSANKVVRIFVSDASGLKIKFNDKEFPSQLEGPQTIIFPQNYEEKK